MIEILLLIIGVILPILIAFWIDSDAKKRGMSLWYAVLPLPVFILFLPLLVFGVEFALIMGMILYTLVGIGWLALRRKHPLLKTQAAQPPAHAVSTATANICPNCGKQIQPDWRKCPYCNTVLKVMSIQYGVARRMMIDGGITCAIGMLFLIMCMFSYGGTALLFVMIFLILIIVGCTLAGVAIIFGDKEKYYCPSCGRLQDKEKGGICLKCRSNCQFIKGQMSRGYRCGCGVLLTLEVSLGFLLLFSLFITLLIIFLLLFPTIIMFYIASSETDKRLKREYLIEVAKYFDQKLSRRLPIPEKGVEVQPPAPQIPSMLCPNCQKPVQSDWISCPYCRTLLKPEAEETEKKRRQDALNAVEELLNKEANFFVDDIKSYLSKNDFEGAEKLLEEKKRLYDRFLELKKGMNDIDKRTAKLSTKLAEGEVTSDAYERAREDLERGKRDIEEEMWKIQRKIFREKYEKPF
ncbi:MAG: zinc-ribbon domain-containing protein [Thermoplasmatales archaeon]|nr:zinc-ribbon domain-containing protein [Thermoplasmatales archaeon]